MQIPTTSQTALTPFLHIRVFVVLHHRKMTRYRWLWSAVPVLQARDWRRRVRARRLRRDRRRGRRRRRIRRTGLKNSESGVGTRSAILNFTSAPQE
jgi:hypothetical protein